MTKLVTTRIDSKIVSRIERAAESLQTDKASLLRRIIIKGLRETEEEEVMRLYKRGEVSLGKACDMLGITKWDAPDLLKKYNAAMNYTLEDLKRDMAP
jgi:predicted HTH domain antitoxin